MKPIYTILFFFFLCSSLGCNKEKRPEKFLSGKYDWLETYSEENNMDGNPMYTVSPGTTGKNYGIRIKRNNKLFLYEDGKLLKEYTVLEFNEYENNYQPYYSATVMIEGEKVYFSLYNGILSSHDWPFANRVNRFKNVKDLP